MRTVSGGHTRNGGSVIGLGCKKDHLPVLRLCFSLFSFSWVFGSFTLLVRGVAVTIVVVIVLYIHLELMCIGLCERVSKRVIERIVSSCA